MKTDEYEVRKNPEAVAYLLHEVERAGAYCGLSQAQIDQLRLLAEEMVSLVLHALDRCKAALWLEENKGQFEIHLKAKASVSPEQREEFRSVATGGKKTRGLGGKVSQMFDDLLEASADESIPMDARYVGLDYGFVNDIYTPMFMPCLTWSMKEYERAAPQPKRVEDGIGLEKSILERVADDVLVTATRKGVEIVTQKRFQ